MEFPGVECRELNVECSMIHLITPGPYPALRFYRKSSGFTPSMSSNVWFSPAMPQMNL